MSILNPPQNFNTYQIGETVLVKIENEWLKGKICQTYENNDYGISLPGDLNYVFETPENIKKYITIHLPKNPDFTFITDDHSRKMIESGYKVVTLCEGWNIIRNFRGESFMFSEDPEINIIMDNISRHYHGHSGASIGWTMRILEHISQVGIDEFKQEW